MHPPFVQAELLQGGSFDNSGVKRNAAARVAEGLRALADQLEGKGKEEGSKGKAEGKKEQKRGKGAKAAEQEEEEEEEEDEEDPGSSLVPAATDMFAADFLKSRIRPHPAHLKDRGEDEEGRRGRIPPAGQRCGTSHTSGCPGSMQGWGRDRRRKGDLWEDVEQSKHVAPSVHPMDRDQDA